MATFQVKHKRGTVKTIEAKNEAMVWRMIRKSGGEPTHYKIVNRSTVSNRTGHV